MSRIDHCNRIERLTRAIRSPNFIHEITNLSKADFDTFYNACRAAGVILDIGEDDQPTLERFPRLP